MFYLHIYGHVHDLRASCQKKVYPLEWKLWMVMSHHVVLGLEPASSVEAASSLQHRAISLALSCILASAFLFSFLFPCPEWMLNKLLIDKETEG